MTTLLKGGVTTEDPRLDRVPWEDPRSLALFGVAPLVEAKQPRSFTWRSGPVTDQGREGACVGHAWTGELTARPKPVFIPDPNDFAYRFYKYIQTLDEEPGEAYSGTSILAGAKAASARGYLEEYRWAKDLDDLVLAVGYIGPAVIGVDWFDGMYEAPKGVLKVKGKKVGGHALLVRGVNVTRRTAIIRNSWGIGWGRMGDAEMSWDELGWLLRQPYADACIPLSRLMPKPA